MTYLKYNEKQPSVVKEYTLTSENALSLRFSVTFDMRFYKQMNSDWFPTYLLLITYDVHNEYQVAETVKNRLYWIYTMNKFTPITETVVGELELSKSQNFVDDVKHILDVNLSYRTKDWIHITYRTDEDLLGLAFCKLIFNPE